MKRMDVKVRITVKNKEIRLPFKTKSLIKKAALKTLEVEKFEDLAEVDVTLVGDNEIREINKEFRDIDSATDVLSFPLGENGIYDINPKSCAKMLGDIVISVERALYQADLYGHGIEREIAFLTVHSMLHLLGYDHVNSEEERKVMREKEELVLEKLGLQINKN